MKDQLSTKKLFRLTTMVFLLVFSFSLLPNKVSAQLQNPLPTDSWRELLGDGAFPLDPLQPTDGGQTNDPIAERQKLDEEQAKKEAEALKKAQDEEDIKLCKEKEKTVNTEVGATGSSQPRQDDAYDPKKPLDSNGDGIPDPIPPACTSANGSAPAYIANNEGYNAKPYNDMLGHQTVGIGHQITGNEPFPVNNGITQAQAQQLYDADYATAQTGAQQSAERHGVNWNNLSPERQTVLTDMSFNMGASGGGGVDGFDNMWGNIRQAQQTGNQASWDAAGDEITNSTYGSQLRTRSDLNANIMRTSDSSLVNQQANAPGIGRSLCQGTTVAWQSPFKLLSQLFNPLVALAQVYVPVQEQSGPLMDKTEAIKKQTKEIQTNTDETRNLSIQICTHLRAIKRIQQQFEKKMVEDANVARIKATEIEKYKQALYGDNGLIKAGYTTLDSEGKEQKGPLFINNNQLYLNSVAYEARNVMIDRIKNSFNPGKDAILNALDGENSFSLNSDFTEEDAKNLSGEISNNETIIAKETTSSDGLSLLNRLPIISGILKPVMKSLAWLTGDSAWATTPTDTTASEIVSSNRRWESRLKAYEPKNTLMGGYLIASDKIDAERNKAVLSARDTSLQSQGFLPIRKCVEKSTDEKTCLNWETIQPGIINKEATAAAANSRLRQYENADTIGEITQGNEPNVVELATNKPAPGGGGAIGPGMTSPSQILQSTKPLTSDAGTNPPQNTDTNNTDTNNNNAEQALNTSGLEGLLSGLFANSNNPDLSSNVDIQGLINLIKQAFGSLWNLLNPLVIVGSKARDNGADLLYWYSPNASSCATTNDWLSAGSNDGVIKTKGQSLGNGTSDSSLVITATTTTQYKLKCTNGNGSSKEKVIEIKK